jgi:hypothetical protein
MSRNYFSEINLHIIWHTKDSAPLLVPDVEEFTHRWLKQKLVNTVGVFGKKDLDWVRQYIRNQREHHAQGSIHDRLERITHPGD